MKIEFLGTSAAEGFPDPFCECVNCQAARTEGGASLRKRSSALLNDDLLIDMGPDLISAIQQRGRSLARVRYAIQTHPHPDHLDQSSFFARKCGVKPVGVTSLHYYGAQAILTRLDLVTSSEDGHGSFTDPAVQDTYQMDVTIVEPWQTYELGPWRLLPVPANHGQPDQQCLLYAIRDQQSGTTLFYATDTSNLPDGSWERLAELGWQFDAIAIDFTFGFAGRSERHMNHEQVLEELEKGRAAGAISRQTRVFATHIAHHSNPSHAELVLKCRAIGLEVAHDGLVVNLIEHQEPANE